MVRWLGVIMEFVMWLTMEPRREQDQTSDLDPVFLLYLFVFSISIIQYLRTNKVMFKHEFRIL